MAISSFEKSDTVIMPSQSGIILGSSSLNIFKYLSLTVSGNFKGIISCKVMALRQLIFSESPTPFWGTWYKSILLFFNRLGVLTSSQKWLFEDSLRHSMVKLSFKTKSVFCGKSIKYWLLESTILKLLISW